MIIVTGGAGFIGSNLVALLEAQGETEIIVCDRLGHDDKWRNLAKRELRHFLSPEQLLPFLDDNANQVRMIFHLGAISTTTERNADLIVKTNFELSTLLWDWCVHHDVRFVYASSAATYGDGAEGFVDDETPAALARFRPTQPYGWSKQLFDRRVARVLSEGKAKPPQWAGLKFFNVYGPNEYHKGVQQSVIASVWNQIKDGQPARLFKSYHADYKDGGQLRDFVWVQDCVDVMRWLWENPNVSGLFNVGSGKARSFADLAAATFKAAGLPPKIDYIDMPDAIRNRYQYFTQADLTKLRSAGFDKPFTSLEDGVARYVTEFLSQPDPYL